MRFGVLRFGVLRFVTNIAMHHMDTSTEYGRIAKEFQRGERRHSWLSLTIVHATVAPALLATATIVLKRTDF
jgi:hypothetical protein